LQLLFSLSGEVIFVDSCAYTVIFICCDCYLFFWKKKRNKFFAWGGTVYLQQQYCSK